MSECTFKEFQAEYPDDPACLAKLMEINFGGTNIHCPGCGALANFSPMGKRRGFACQECGHHVYPCAGTIFRNSSTKLTIWFFAMYLMTSTRHVVAAKEIERQTAVTYKCAWRICHELRKLMTSADNTTPLSGHVEIDETRVGGKQKMRDRRRRGDNKTIVMGIVERNGNMRAGPIDDLSGANLENIVKNHVKKGTIVSTDEWSGYNRLAALGFDHGHVNHFSRDFGQRHSPHEHPRRTLEPIETRDPWNTCSYLF